jgi:hypothetical protein
VYFLYSAWRLLKSVVTLAVQGKTISDRRFRRFGVTVCHRHRRPLTEVDEIYGWLATVERRLTLCVSPVFSVAVMEKCCDACGDGEYCFRSMISTIRVTACHRHRRPLTEVDEIYGWLVTVERRLTLCVFTVFSVAVMEKCCDACGEGEYCFRSKVSTIRGGGVSEASTAVDRSRPDLRLVIYSINMPTFCVFPVFCVVVMEKCCDVGVDGEYSFRSGFSTFENVGVSEASVAVDGNR